MVEVDVAARRIDERLSEQKRNTDSMESFTTQLVEAVSVFQLENDNSKETV